MITAVVKDFSDLPGVEVFYCRDRNLAPLNWGQPAWVEATRHDMLWKIWKKHIRCVDAVLPIAPETDGLLVSLAEMIRQSGCHLFASTASALAQTTSKSATATCLQSHKIPVIPTHRPGQLLPASAYGWIIKPDDGAGAHGVHYAADLTKVNSILAQSNAQDTLIIQPYIPGPVASLCVLYHTHHPTRKVTLLAANTIIMRQHQGRFIYADLQVGAMNDHKDCFRPLVRAIGEAIPGFYGYIGIDLIRDNSQWRVMEINPRITSSYPRLRHVLGKNPAALLVESFLKDRP